MKLAVTYENGEIFQHFGHTEQMKLYTIEHDEVVSSEVVSTAGSGHGALAGFLQENGVEVLICGGIGGGARTALEQAGIKLYGGCKGSADQAVENYLNHTLMYDPSVKCDHHGEDHKCGDDCHHGNCGEEADPKDQIITLTTTDENGKEENVLLKLIAMYPCGGQDYIALTPDLDAPELEADIYLYRCSEEDGHLNVEEILEDEEFAAAADAFQNWQMSRDE